MRKNEEEKFLSQEGRAVARHQRRAAHLVPLNEILATLDRIASLRLARLMRHIFIIKSSFCYVSSKSSYLIGKSLFQNALRLLVAVQMPGCSGLHIKSRFFNTKSRFFTRKCRFFNRKLTCARIVACFIIQLTFFNSKSRFLISKSGFFDRKSGFFY